MCEEDFIDYFLYLYSTVLYKEKTKFNVEDDAVLKALRVMRDAYQPDPKWKTKNFQSIGKVDYNNPALRCAYLHKHATCYTGLVYYLLLMTMRVCPSVRFHIKCIRPKIRLCSLGGGPGTDVIGCLAALSHYLVEFVPWTVTVVDSSQQWRTSFNMLLQELESPRFGSLHRMVTNFNSGTEYLCTNLLEDWSSDYSVTQAISTADIVMMVKFISAAACHLFTEVMVKRIFDLMKQGAILFFIDNAVGGFHEMIKGVALKCGMTSLYGPLTHYEYEDWRFSIIRFGCPSQSKTRIVFQVFQKKEESRMNIAPISFLEETQSKETQSSEITD